MFKRLKKLFGLKKLLKMVCNKQNIELCFNDIKLMLFWNGVNVIHSITFLLPYIKISVQKIISMTKVSIPM